MLTVIFIIGLVMVIAGIIISCKHRNDEDYLNVYVPLCILGGMLCCIIIPISIGLVEITGEYRIDQQIEVCQQENERLEDSIKIVVQDYLNHEHITYSEMTNDTATTWVSLLPELSSNEIIIKQMDIIQNNNTAIRNLKNDKINLGIWKFLIYFGR